MLLPAELRQLILDHTYGDEIPQYESHHNLFRAGSEWRYTHQHTGIQPPLEVKNWLEAVESIDELAEDIMVVRKQWVKIFETLNQEHIMEKISLMNHWKRWPLPLDAR